MISIHTSEYQPTALHFSMSVNLNRRENANDYTWGALVARFALFRLQLNSSPCTLSWDMPSSRWSLESPSLCDESTTKEDHQFGCWLKSVDHLLCSSAGWKRVLKTPKLQSSVVGSSCNVGGWGLFCIGRGSQPQSELKLERCTKKQMKQRSTNWSITATSAAIATQPLQPPTQSSTGGRKTASDPLPACCQLCLGFRGSHY